MYKDPELASSNGHSKYIAPYRAAPTEEVWADRTASAQQMIEGPYKKEEDKSPT